MILLFLVVNFFITGDGIFDQIKNEDIIQCVWMTTEKPFLNEITVHNQSGLAVDMIMKTALARRALDNITCVFIGLENWEKQISLLTEKFMRSSKSSYKYQSKSTSQTKNM